MTTAALALDDRAGAQMAMPTASAPPIPANAAAADFTLTIAPYVLEPSPKHRFPMVAYNGQVPRPAVPA